jgi:hypothetical protein
MVVFLNIFLPLILAGTALFYICSLFSNKGALTINLTIKKCFTSLESYKTTISTALSLVCSCLPLLKTVRHIKSPILKTMDRNQRSVGVRSTSQSVFGFRLKTEPREWMKLMSSALKSLQHNAQTRDSLEVLAADGYYRCNDEKTSNALRGLRSYR